MPITLTDIDVGAAPGDGTGDPARTAFQAINTNNATLEANVLTQAEVDARVLVKSPFDRYIGQNLQTGATYTLVLGDGGKLVEMNYATANTLTIPANGAVAFPVDTRIDVYQHGAGQTTIAITSDTLRGLTKIGGQYQMVSLWKRASTEWVVIGGIA